MPASLNTAPVSWLGEGDAVCEDAIYDLIACRFAASASVDMVETIAGALTELCAWYGATAAVLAGPGRPILARNSRAEPVAIATVLPTRDKLAPQGKATSSLGLAQERMREGASLRGSHPGIVWHWRSCAVQEVGSDLVVLGWQGCQEDGLGGRLDRLFRPELLQRVARLIGAGLRRAGQSEARRELLRRLSETQRLDVASTTALAMAHNLNNVLAAMLGHTEIALEALQGQARGYGAVMAIKNASERASELIEGILGLGERDVTEAPLSLAQLCVDTIELIRPAIPDRITLELNDTTDGAWILGKAAQLQQVILNLVRNAVQAIPAQGRIMLQLSAQEGQENLFAQVGILASRSYLVLRIADNGIGITPEARGSIFRPFVTTRPSGTGLGLSAVAQIVSAHEGAIRLVAPEQQGTVFEVWLPQRVAVDRHEALRGDGQPVVLVAKGTMRERFEDLVAALGYEPCTVEDISGIKAFLEAERTETCPVMIYTEHPDLDTCLMEAECFRAVCPMAPLMMLVPGRMPMTPFGGYSVQNAWLAGADNSSAIAACVRLMVNLSQQNTEGMIN